MYTVYGVSTWAMCSIRFITLIIEQTLLDYRVLFRLRGVSQGQVSQP
jgi:hypothetical protein